MRQAINAEEAELGFEINKKKQRNNTTLSPEIKALPMILPYFSRNRTSRKNLGKM